MQLTSQVILISRILEWGGKSHQSNQSKVTSVLWLDEWIKWQVKQTAIELGYEQAMPYVARKGHGTPRGAGLGKGPAGFVAVLMHRGSLGYWGKRTKCLPACATLRAHLYPNNIHKGRLLLAAATTALVLLCIPREKQRPWFGRASWEWVAHCWGMWAFLPQQAGPFVILAQFPAPNPHLARSYVVQASFMAKVARRKAAPRGSSSLFPRAPFPTQCVVRKYGWVEFEQVNRLMATILSSVLVYYLFVFCIYILLSTAQRHPCLPCSKCITHVCQQIWHQFLARWEKLPHQFVWEALI